MSFWDQMAVSKTGEPHVEAQHIETSCVCPSIKRCFSLASENMVVTPESRNMASSGHIKATLNWCDSNTFKSPSGHVNNPEANRMWNIYAIQFWWVAFLYVMQFPKVDLNHLTVSIRKQVVGLSFKSTITTSDYVMEAAAHTKFQLSDCILSQCLFFDGRPRYCWLIYELPVCCRTKNRVRSLLLTSQTCSIIFVVLKQCKPHFCRLK